jgi:hypothetical protein
VLGKLFFPLLVILWIGEVELMMYYSLPLLNKESGWQCKIKEVS